MYTLLSIPDQGHYGPGRVTDGHYSPGCVTAGHYGPGHVTDGHYSPGCVTDGHYGPRRVGRWSLQSWISGLTVTVVLSV